MKIILENALERYAWETMVLAHRGWWKNHGDTLRDHMEWQFDDVLKADTEDAIKAEVERRLAEEFDTDLTATEAEYIQGSLVGYEGHELQEDYEAECRQEYRDLQDEIADRREELTDSVTQELRNAWYKYLLAPEDLIVVFDGEVIQGK